MRMKRNSKKLISIVIPCFNEEKNIREAFRVLDQVLSAFRKAYRIEYIFVDNGSADRTRGEIPDSCPRKPQGSRRVPFAQFRTGILDQAGFDFSMGTP